MENQTNNIFITDIHIASFLVSVGTSFTGVDRSSKKVAFIFERSDKINKLIKDYLADKASANPRALFQSFASLKGVIFGETGI